MKRHARSTSARVGGALHRKVRKGEGKRAEAEEARSARQKDPGGTAACSGGKGRLGGEWLVGEGAARGGRPGGSGSRGSGQRLSLGLDGRVIGALGLQFDRHVPREPSQVAFERRGGRGERWAKRWPGMPKMGCLGGLWHAWDA